MSEGVVGVPVSGESLEGDGVGVGVGVVDGLGVGVGVGDGDVVLGLGDGLGEAEFGDVDGDGAGDFVAHAEDWEPLVGGPTVSVAMLSGPAAVAGPAPGGETPADSLGDGVTTGVMISLGLGLGWVVPEPLPFWHRDEA